MKSNCTYSYPAGMRITTFIGPTGECLRLIRGAFLGQTEAWPYCREHHQEVIDLVTMHADTREFPLTDVSVDEFYVWQVMES